MRLNDIIKESIDFSVNRLETHDGQQVWADPFSVEQDVKCWVCDGTGKDTHHGDTCDMCRGKGTYVEWKSPYTPLNVANGNAAAILDMLGIEFDYAGIIPKEDLPIMRRKLIAIKNGNVDAYTAAPSVSQGNARASIDSETGLSKISRGPKMYDMGRSNSQINKYIDILLEIIDFAQKNDGVVGWG